MPSFIRLARVLPLLLPTGSGGELGGLIAFQRQFSRHFDPNAGDARRADAALGPSVGEERFPSAPEREACGGGMAECVRDGYDRSSQQDTVAIRFSHTRKRAVATATRTHVHRFASAGPGAPGGAGERNAGAAGAY